MTIKSKIIVTSVGGIVAIGLLAATIVLLRRPEAGRPPRGDERRIVVPAPAGPTPEQVQVDTVVNAVLAGGDPSLCAHAGSQEAVDQCFATVAYGRDDERVCGSMSDAEQREECRGAIIGDRAERERNPELCRSIQHGELRISCYVRATSEEGTTEAFCSTLEEPDRTSCLRAITLDEALERPTPSPVDSDHDGLSDADEERRGTDPMSADTDHDGVDDGQEIVHGTDTLKPDTDSDGLTDGDEVRIYGTDPTDADSDGDGFGDGAEVSNGYNPLGSGRLQ